MKCSRCHEELPGDGDFVRCRWCDGNIHYECSGIKESTYRSMSKKTKDSWKCVTCRRTTTAPSDIRTNGPASSPGIGPSASDNDAASGDEPVRKGESTNRMLRMEEDVSEIKNSLSFLCSKYDDLHEQLNLIKELRGVIDALKNDLANKDRVIEDLKDKINDLEQSKLSKSLDIVGVSLPENRSCSNIICDIAKNIGIEEFTDSDIDDCFIVPKKKDGGSEKIVLKFISTIKRDQWLKKRKHIKNIASNFNKGKTFYINESLTSYYSNLFWKTKGRCKEKGFQYAWINHGKILVKKDPNASVIRIKSEKDINNIY